MKGTKGGSERERERERERGVVLHEKFVGGTSLEANWGHHHKGGRGMARSRCRLGWPNINLISENYPHQFLWPKLAPYDILMVIQSIRAHKQSIQPTHLKDNPQAHGLHIGFDSSLRSSIWCFSLDFLW